LKTSGKFEFGAYWGFGYWDLESKIQVLVAYLSKKTGFCGEEE
jgi:hypothetical protein